MEVNPWTGNGSIDVQSLHNVLLGYDNEYNPDYRKLTDLKNMKRVCNILGDLNP